MDTGQLSPDVAPPDELEERTVARLRREGLLRARRRWPLVAAAVVIFAAGVAAGAGWRNPGSPSATDPRFLLLLHGAGTAGGEDERLTVEAYRAWAAKLRHEGRVVTGERLSRNSVAVPSDAVNAEPLGGFFIVSAASLADAVAVAESAPHVARGGHIVVRPIDTP
jgi:hypothetical protein